MDFAQKIKSYCASSPVQQLIKSYDFTSSSVNPELTNGLTDKEKLQLKIIQQELLISALRKDHTELIIENHKQQEKLSALELELAELKEFKNSLTLGLCGGEKLSEEKLYSGLAFEVNHSNLPVMNIPREDFKHFTETASNSSNGSKGPSPAPPPLNALGTERTEASLHTSFLEESFAGTSTYIRPKEPEIKLNPQVSELFPKDEQAFLKKIPIEAVSKINEIMEVFQQELSKLEYQAAQDHDTVLEAFRDEFYFLKLDEKRNIHHLSPLQKFLYQTEIKQKSERLKSKCKSLTEYNNSTWQKQILELKKEYAKEIRNLQKVKNMISHA